MKKILFIIIILYSNCALGQNKSTQNFSGNFENGIATYFYYENDNYERIYDGGFEYSGSVEKYEGLGFTITGNYTDNLKDGKWVFSVKNTKSPVIQMLSTNEKLAIQAVLELRFYTELSQEQIQNMLNAYQTSRIGVYLTYSSVLSGNYVSGKLDGIWNFKEISTGGKDIFVEFKNEKNSPINSTVSFKENHLIGDFSYKGNEQYIKGQFTNKGDLDGKWVSKWNSKGNEFETITEFENGKLIKMIERNASTGEILSRDIRTDSEGLNMMILAIHFWAKDIEEFNQSNISNRNYMFKFDKGIVKQKSNYNFK